MAPRVGDPAPGFRLPGTGGRTYGLDDVRSRPVVIVFYPGDGSPVCTAQLNAYSEGIDRFAGLGADVLAISPQDVASHEDFDARSGPFPFPLLADEDKGVGRAYGIVGPLGFYRRAVFVVGADGVIRYAHRSLGGLTFRSTDEVAAALAAARPAGPPGPQPSRDR